MKMRIKKMRENAKLPKIHNGNWADCYISQIGCVDFEKIDNGGEFTFDDIIWYGDKFTYSSEDIIVIKLGFALELPKGKELILASRSGTFRKTGLILTNGIGIGDDTFIGDSDEYLAMFYATREATINVGDRLLQIRIQDSMPNIEFEEVEMFNNSDRGSYGSTGR